MSTDMDSLDVFFHVLKGGDLPDGWTCHQNDSGSMWAPDHVWDAIYNHPEVIKYYNLQKEKERMVRVRSLRIPGTPDVWGINKKTGP